ncbi:MAG: type II secretion system F family protein [Planctomycetota bacterium]
MSRRLEILLHSLATSIGAGLSAEKTLALLATRTLPPGFAAQLAAARAALSQGSPLSEALSQPPRPLLSRAEKAILAAGESCGEIERALLVIVEERERDRARRQELVRRAAYPLVVLHFAALVFAWTAALQGRSPVAAFLLLLGPFYLVAAAGAWIHVSSRTRPPVARLLLRLPLAGRLTRDAGLVSFLRVLRMAYAAGVPLPAGTALALSCVRNHEVRDEIRRAAGPVWDGGRLTTNLALVPGIDEALAGLLRAGEESGTLAESLTQALRIREAALEAERSRLVTVSGWSLYGLVLLLVGAKIVSFYAGYLGGLG